MSMKNWFKNVETWRVAPKSRAERELGRKLKARIAELLSQERERAARPEQLQLNWPKR